MNKDLARMLSEEVLRLKEESNGTITINQALEIIVCQYKQSQGLENQFNNSLHYKGFVFNTGDKFKVAANDITATIVEINNDIINLSQHSSTYGYYRNIVISANVLVDQIKMKNLIRIKVGEDIGKVLK